MNTASRGLLAFAAGFVDTATFVHLGGLFAAHVTGNFVVFAAALSRGLVVEDFLKLVTFPVFVVAVLVGTVIHERLQGRAPARAHLRILGVEGALLLGAGAVALSGSMSGDTISLGSLDVGVALAMVVAMGLQNSVHRFVKGPMTTVMTGNVTQFTTLVGRTLVGRKDESGQAPIRWAPSLALLGGFALGCVASAVSTRAMGLQTSLVAGVVVLVVVGIEARRSR